MTVPCQSHPHERVAWCDDPTERDNTPQPAIRPSAEDSAAVTILSTKGELIGWNRCQVRRHIVQGKKGRKDGACHPDFNVHQHTKGCSSRAKP